MAYAKSELINVFPTSNRGTVEKELTNGSKTQVAVDPEARLNTESNLTGILKHITDKKSFILNYTSGNSLEFVIDGYYFKLKDPEILKLKPLYAYIEYKSEEESKTASGYVFQQLNGGDKSDSSEYTGVTFTTTYDSSKKDLSLQLLDEKGETPFDNYIKFRTNDNFRSVYIDDGDLDT